MTNKDVRETIKIEGETYDIIYRSGITGNLGTWKDLVSGRFDSKKKIALVDKGQITPKMITIVSLRKRTGIKGKLIIDPDGFQKPRCPRCYYAHVEEHANKRTTISLSSNYPVVSASVDFGTGRMPRYRETSKYCDCCDTTYVAAKVVVNEY